MDTIRIGIIGLGANCRLRHVPGFRACQDVEITAVCNRRPESTERAAQEFGIPKQYSHWEDLIADRGIDAVLIGTWPYLHCPITLAALEAGKHVLTEARMAMNATEARQMVQTSQQHPELVCQIVPSPFGLKGYRVVRELIEEGFLGDLREVVVLGTNSDYADPHAPLHWRQSAELSGLNMLHLGILHETVIRWVPDPVRVLAQVQFFTRERPDRTSGHMHRVGTPDSVQVLTHISGGARGMYHLSSVIHHGPVPQIHLYGSEGTLQVQLSPEEQLFGATVDETELRELPIPPDKAGSWRVEADFIDAIRGEGQVQFTDFATGLRYMEFTEAVALSAARGTAVELPLQ